MKREILSKEDLKSKIKSLNPKLIFKANKDLSISNISGSFNDDLGFIGIGFYEEKGIKAIVWIKLDDTSYECYIIDEDLGRYEIHHQLKNVLKKLPIFKDTNFFKKPTIPLREVIRNVT